MSREQFSFENPENGRPSVQEVLKGAISSPAETSRFEVVHTRLEEVEAIRAFREKARGSKLADFYHLFEQVTELRKQLLPNEQEYLQELAGELTPRAHRMNPRSADLYMGLLAEIDGTVYEPKFDMTSRKLGELRESGDLETLISPSSTYLLKENRIATRLEGDVLGRRSLDRNDRKKKNEANKEEWENTEQPTEPFEDNDESKPGMDEMERGPEGEPVPAIWEISPAHGGYFKERSFDTFVPERNVWIQSTSTKTQMYNNLVVTPELELTARLFGGRSVRIPVPYTHELLGVMAPVGGIARVDIFEDQNGDITLTKKEDSTADSILVEVALRQKTKDRPQIPQEVSNFAAKFSPETQQFLDQTRAEKATTRVRASKLARYTMSRLTYSNDSSFNEIYDTHPDGYIAAIDEHKQADCDVANTYFAALCAELKIAARHVVGHMVKGKDQAGNSRITGGTGHAWTEIWDDEVNRWERVDATPPGDSQQEEEPGEPQEQVPGDYGEQEAIGPTDEELEELQEKLKELSEEMKYTPAEREIAEVGNVEMEKAREILKEITEAEETRMPNGERIVDVLAKLFSMIVESRRTTVKAYTGPLRKREGGEYLEDIVSHKIGMLSGDSDPASRAREVDRHKMEQVFGGFDVYMIGDKSGSMKQTVSLEEKWRLQRKAQLCVLSSLYRFEQNSKNNGVHMTDPLSIRTQVTSFRDSHKIDVDKPLSNTFTTVEKLKLWDSLKNMGVGNGDTAALRMVREQITAEREQMEVLGKTDNRLRIILPCSDGEPDDAASVQKEAEELGKLNSVVVGIGLTETASSVPIIFDTEYSRGDIAKDMNDLPFIVAKHIVLEAVKLFPEQGRKTMKPYLDAILAKFGQL